MKLWKREMTLEGLNAVRKNTMLETIGIEFIAFTDDTITARMPVDHRTHQPYGILHGGASAALAETLGSIAAECAMAPDKVVGIELHIHHLRQASEGWVTGVVRPVRVGRRIQVWEITVTNAEGKEVSKATLTTMVV